MKLSLIHGRSIPKLRESIKRSEDIEDRFLFGIDKVVPCSFHLEHHVNEKPVIMVILKGFKHRTNGEQANIHFIEIEQKFNNKMLSEKWEIASTSKQW